MATKQQAGATRFPAWRTSINIHTAAGLIGIPGTSPSNQDLTQPPRPSSGQLGAQKQVSRGASPGRRAGPSLRGSSQSCLPGSARTVPLPPDLSGKRSRSRLGNGDAGEVTPLESHLAAEVDEVVIRALSQYVVSGESCVVLIFKYKMHAYVFNNPVPYCVHFILKKFFVNQSN